MPVPTQACLGTPRPRLRRLPFCALAVAVAAGFLATDASAQRRHRPVRSDEVKFDTLLRDVALDNAEVPVIVEFNDETNADTLIHAEGGRKGRRLGGMRGHTARMTKRMLRRLARNGAIRRVHYDRPVEALLGRTAAATGALTVHQQMGYTGAGIGVAVIDSGVWRMHADLRYAGSSNSRIVRFVDFVGTGITADDDWGHGTHVAGIIAGNGNESVGARVGIAPHATIVALKALDRDGRGRISSIIAALDWAVANRAAHNIRVINMSLGAGVFESYNTDPLTLAAKRAVDAGIVVVAAAGNIGRNASGQTQYGAITAPGNAPWVLTVGAADSKGNTDRRDDDIAPYSSRGPTAHDFLAKPDLVAPGTSITSLASPNSKMYVEKPQSLVAGSRPSAFKPYLTLSGTSMATPAVAGTVALMLQANPHLTPNLVKAVLQYTAETKGGFDVLSQGAGFLNARGAVTLARYFRDARPGSRYPMASNWSRQIIWGNRLVKGGVITPGANAWTSNLVWGENIVWGESEDNVVWGLDCGGANCANTVWGTNTGAQGLNVVWGLAEGLNVVWGNNIAWGQNIVWGESTDPDASWGSSGNDDSSYGDETPEVLAFDPLLWDLEHHPELTVVEPVSTTTTGTTTTGGLF